MSADIHFAFDLELWENWAALDGSSHSVHLKLTLFHGNQVLSVSLAQESLPSSSLSWVHQIEGKDFDWHPGELDVSFFAARADSVGTEPLAGLLWAEEAWAATHLAVSRLNAVAYSPAYGKSYEASMGKLRAFTRSSAFAMSVA